MIEVKKVYKYIVAVSFILFICFPTVPDLKLVKVLLLFLLIFIAFIKKVKLKREIIVLLSIFVLYGLFNTVFGILMGNPGAIRNSTVFLLWPILFTLLLGLLNKRDILEVDRIFIFCCKVIFLLFLVQLLEAITKNTSIINTIFGDKATSYVNLKDGYLLAANPAVSSLIFLLPYLISQSILHRKRKYVILSILGLTIPFLTGRRSLIMIIVLSIFVFLFLIIGLVRKIEWSIFHRTFKIIRNSAILLFLISIGLFLNYKDQIIEIFFANKVDSDDIRSEQFVSLWNGFLSSPLIGNGSGAVASVIRSVDMPWSYELFYVSLLFQQGIIGLSLYVIGFVWITFGLVKIFKYNQNELGFHALSVLVAFICFLIASATNPYVAKLDYMWIIFYPIALINCFNRKEE